MKPSEISSKVRASGEWRPEVGLGIRDQFAIAGAFGLATSNSFAVGLAESNALVQSEGRISISGTASILSIENVPVTVVLEESGDQTSVEVVATMPDEWELTSSFPTLDRFPFDVLPLGRVCFVYSNIRRADYTWPGNADTKIPLSAGLNLLSTTRLNQLPGLAGVLTGLITDAELKAYGPFSSVAGETWPVGELLIPIPVGTNDRGFRIGFDDPGPGVTLKRPAVGVMLTRSTARRPQSIDLFVQAELAGKLQFRAAIPLVPDALTFSAQPLAGESFTAGEIVKRLPGGAGFRDYIPTEVKNVLSGVELRDFTMVVGTSPKSVMFIGLTIGKSGSKPWPVIPGVLALRDLALQTTITDPSGMRLTNVFISARARLFPKKQLFSSPFEFTIDLQKSTGSWKIATISGEYAGRVTLGQIVREIVGASGSIPAELDNFAFANFGVSVDRTTQSYRVYGTVEAMFPLLDTEVFSSTRIEFTKSGDVSKRVDVSGGLSVGGQNFQFSMEFSTTGTNQLTASWTAGEGEELQFEDIASTFGFEIGNAPPELDLALTSASFSYDFNTKSLVLQATSKNYGQATFVTFKSLGAGAGSGSTPAPGNQASGGTAVATTVPRTYLFALNIDKNIELSKIDIPSLPLPIGGDDLPQLSVDGMRVCIASRAIPGSATSDSTTTPPAGGTTSDQANLPRIEDVNQLISQANPEATPLPATGIRKGITLGATLNVGSRTTPIETNLGGARRQQTGGSGTANLGAPTAQFGGTPLPAAGTGGADSGQTDVAQGDSAQADSASWYPVQKAFGPVYFDRVGMSFQDQKLQFLVDAALTAAGLTISLDGLSVRSSIKEFTPEFGLRGLGIDFKGGPLTIGGAFLKIGDEYAGTAVIGGASFTLSAVGAYTSTDGEPSMFLYALLDYPLGGPPFFFVNGLAAGFGYNRSLKVPPIDGIARFPLVSQAMQGTGTATKEGLTPMLRRLTSSIRPSVGEHFLAVGVKFNSFKLIDSFALLTVTFGRRFELNLLGLSRAVTPPPVAGDATPPLAQVELALKATFNPSAGFLGVEARLTPNSYILDRKCRLTGGFAFYSWMKGDKAGDFVLTLGGYHPRFKPPAHYPTVPRLGINWQISDALSVKGEAYFALTASALMAGGQLSAVWQQSDLKAWFKAGLNFLIAWKPFYYDADISVSVGASASITIFGIRNTLSFEVGAAVRIWGPEFSGTASINLSVVSIEVEFGDAGKEKKLTVDWPTFQQSFLPKEEEICSVSIADGLLAGDDGSQTSIVNPQKLVLITNSAVAVKSLKRTAGGNQIKNTIGIAPMGIPTLKSSTHKVTIKRKSVAVDDVFEFTPVYKNMPAALWGSNASPSLNGERFIQDVPAGWQIQPKKNRQPKKDRKSIDLQDAIFETTPVENAFDWTPSPAPPPSTRKQSMALRGRLAEEFKLTSSLATPASMASLAQSIGSGQNSAEG